MARWGGRAVRVWEPALARWPVPWQLWLQGSPFPSCRHLAFRPCYCALLPLSKCCLSADAVPSGCPELLAPGIRDEKPVTSIHGPGLGSKHAGVFLHTWTIFLCLIPHFLPPSSPVLFPSLPDFPVRGDWSVLSPEGYVLGREPEGVRHPPSAAPATQLAVGLAVCVFSVLTLYFPRDGYLWVGGLSL